MPNPQMPHPPVVDHFDIARDWRVLLRFQNGDGYSAHLEHFKDGEWIASGPMARSRRSAPCVLQRLADAYRSFGDAIEHRFTFEQNTNAGEGCPRCGYTHININQQGARITWHCPACSGHGGKPPLSQQ